MKIKKYITDKKSLYSKIFGFVVLLVLYFIIYKIYIPRVNAFGCSDDCFNFMGGYFILKGKTIFTEFFFNHQPFAAYISYFIQYFTQPHNIYELVLRHRQFIILTGFIFNVLFLFRFGIKSLFFTFIFELSKFYFFGDRFLAEAIIVYPLIYLLGLCLINIEKKQLYKIDYVLSAIFSWLIFYLREPYIPLTFFLFFFLIYKGFKEKIVRHSLFLFTGLLFLTLFLFNLSDYFYNVVTINLQSNIINEIRSQLFGGPVQMFFYPFFIFLYGPINIIKNLLIEVNLVFLLLVFLLVKDKKYNTILFIFLALGLSNLRVNLPGAIFYEAFHMIVWFGFFVFTTVYLIFQQYPKKLFSVLIVIYFIILLSLVTSPKFFANEKINTENEFITNYGQNLEDGEVVKLLANKKKDTLFLDGSDDLVYWQSGVLSGYKYTWYTGIMSSVKEYNEARIFMFKNNPPDFYRAPNFCNQKELPLPSFIKDDYTRLNKENHPSCIYVKNERLKSISKNQISELLKWKYTIPK